MNINKKKLVGIILLTVFSTWFLTVGFLLWALDIDGTKLGNLSRFLGALKFIETRYVNTVDDTTVMNGAISGMVQALGDPHSIYLDSAMYRQLTEQVEGHFGGIGVYMGFKEGKVELISVIPDTPGERAGLLPNDEILAVNGVAVAEMQPEEVALNIRGEVGTEVNILVHRAGEEDKVYTIVRDTITVKTVAGRMLEGDLGYLRIAAFSENTGEEFATTYEALKKQGAKGIILDLRANPGGLVTSCVEVARHLVPAGNIVSVIDRDGDRQDFDSDLTAIELPLTVLIDGNSASAAEILAGALQDTHTATIVGTKSYGKGSVQTVIPLFHDDAVKLTIAKYYTPSGRSIDGIGIEPDVVVELPPNATSDEQLQKATAVLLGQISPGEEG
ncbi:MAG: S41 family peptidase [Selenomonadaceae bacterium]|nr:S41 family peptidase [Selenomonadaceae bacterium]